MNLSALTRPLNIAIDTDPEITGIVMDSRAAAPSSLFLAIQGLTVDGAAYAQDALSRGAAYALPVTRAQAAQIAARFCQNPADSLRLFAVTGTNGKTSITYFLEAVLSAAQIKTGVIGTTGALLNGQPLNIAYATSTTPDCVELHKILRAFADENAEACVMEATSHALALDKLAGLSFEIGIFTNLTQDHMDFHKTFDDYAAAKSRLFAQSRISVVNNDDPYASQMLAAASGKAVTYGLRQADYTAKNIQTSAEGVAFDAASKAANLRLTLPIPGKFTVYNALAVFAAATEAGVDPAITQAALSKQSGVPGRIQPIPNNRGIAVIVDYAHSPDGLENILTSAREFTKGDLIVVFGCGGNRDRTKRPIMGDIAKRLADFQIVTSDNPRDENPDDIINEICANFTDTNTFIKIADRELAIKTALTRAKPADTVVLSGKGHENYQEFEQKRRVHFDDAEIARKYLS